MKRKIRRKKVKRVRKVAQRRRRFRHFSLFLRRVFPLLLCAIFGWVTYYFAIESSFFLISSFDIEGTRKYVNSTDVKNLLYTNYFKRNLLLINTRDMRSLLKDRFLGANDISVRKVYPDQLKVVVTERIPLAILHGSKYQDDFLIDKEGYVLGVVDESVEDLPTINYSEEVKIGDFVNPDLIPVYFEFIEALDSSDVKATSVSFHPSHLGFFTAEGTEVLIANDKNKKNAFTALSRLIHNLTMEGKNATLIDLRYDKVVVSY